MVLLRLYSKIPSLLPYGKPFPIDQSTERQQGLLLMQDRPAIHHSSWNKSFSQRGFTIFMQPFSYRWTGSGPQLPLGYTCHAAAEVSEWQTCYFWEHCLLVPDDHLVLQMATRELIHISHDINAPPVSFCPHLARTGSLTTCSFLFSPCKSHFQVSHQTTQNLLMHTSQKFYQS